MKLFLTSLLCSLALWVPAGADDPPCIDGFQTFPNKHVRGAAGYLCADTEEECKQACAEETDCAAVDYNFGRIPWEGERCWMHSVETLAASPMKNNRKANHIVKCTVEGEHIFAVGPSVDDPVDGIFGVEVSSIGHQIPVIWTQIPELPEQNIIGIRAYVHNSAGEMLRLVVSGVEWSLNSSVDYYDYKFSIIADLTENGIVTMFVNDTACEVIGGDLIMHPNMFVQVTAAYQNDPINGDGIGYRNGNPSHCRSATTFRLSNAILDSFDDTQEDVRREYDDPCKEVALQFLYSSTDNAQPEI